MDVIGLVCSSVHARVTWSKHKTLIALSYSHNYTGEDMLFVNLIRL